MSIPNRLSSHSWPPLPSASVEPPSTPPCSPIPDDLSRSPPIAIPKFPTLADDDANDAVVEKPCPKLSRGGINYVW